MGLFGNYGLGTMFSLNPKHCSRLCLGSRVKVSLEFRAQGAGFPLRPGCLLYLIGLSIQLSVLLAVLLHIWSFAGQTFIQHLLSHMLTGATRYTELHVMRHGAGNWQGPNLEHPLLQLLFNQTVGTASMLQDDTHPSSFWQLCSSSMYDSVLGFATQMLLASGRRMFR